MLMMTSNAEHLDSPRTIPTANSFV